MRLLSLSPHRIYPPRHGTATREFHLARELAARHEVTVVGFVNAGGEMIASRPQLPFAYVELPWSPVRSGRLARWFRRFGMLQLSGASPENRAKLREIIENRGIEAAIVQNLPLVDLLPELCGVPIVWVEDGIFSDLRHPSLKSDRNLYRRIQDWLEYFRWRRLEAWARRKAEVLIAVSEPEAEILRRRLRGMRPLVVVPNAVNVADFSDTPRHPLGAQALFVGSRWYANIEALEFFVRKVMPRVRERVPQFRLVVAGEVCGSRELRLGDVDALHMAGFVEDLRPLYAAAAVFVAPLLRGHGTRIKILEAMAAGVPVVSTAKGAEGLDLEPGKHLLVASDPDAFAAAVVRLIEDRDLAGRISADARDAVRARYDSRNAAACMERALAILSRRERSSRSGKERAVDAGVG
jgi:glycosyltransferase involved in cell wall biosynthesis